MNKPHGILIVNRFLNTNKFSDISARLMASAERLGAELSLYTNDEFLPLAGASGGLIPEEEPDFVLFYDKDVRLASQLEKRGMRLYNSSRAIALCDDKSLMHIELDGLVPMPKTVSAPFTYGNIGYTNTDFVPKMFALLGAPLVIKEVFGSFGQQVYLANDVTEAEQILQSVGGRPVIFQEFISSSAGHDVRINVVGGRAIASMYRFNEHGDFRANITNGGSMRPHTPSPEEEELAVRTAGLLGLDFCGVDILEGPDGEPLLCEVNSNAHFKSIEECTGVNAADEIVAWAMRGAR